MTPPTEARIDAALPASVAQLDINLFAIGGAIPADVPVSWAPKGAWGWMPNQCYVFRGRDSSLVLDTGLAIHRAEIEAGIRAVLGPAPSLKLLASRWEPEALINLPWMVNTFAIPTVYSVGELDPMDFFSAFDVANSEAHFTATRTGARLSPIAPGEVVAVGEFELECLRTTLRLLSTNWFYERRTKTLFSADSWGFLTHPNRKGPFATRGNQSQLSLKTVVNAYRGKFSWLAGADCRPLMDDLERLMVTRPISRICPNYGGIVEGAAACATLLEHTVQALGIFGRERRPSVYAGFDWDRALSEAAVISVEDAPVPSRYEASATISHGVGMP